MGGDLGDSQLRRLDNFGNRLHLFDDRFIVPASGYCQPAYGLAVAEERDLHSPQVRFRIADQRSRAGMVVLLRAGESTLSITVWKFNWLCTPSGLATPDPNRPCPGA